MPKNHTTVIALSNETCMLMVLCAITISLGLALVAAALLNVAKAIKGKNDDD